MSGPIVDDGARTLLGDIARAYHIEPTITQIHCRFARQPFRLRRIQNFDFDANSIRRARIVWCVTPTTRWPERKQLPCDPSNAAQNQEDEKDPAIATPRP
jgi:hypothetical protein